MVKRENKEGRRALARFVLRGTRSGLVIWEWCSDGQRRWVENTITMSGWDGVSARASERAEIGSWAPGGSSSSITMQGED